MTAFLKSYIFFILSLYFILCIGCTDAKKKPSQITESPTQTQINLTKLDSYANASCLFANFINSPKLINDQVMVSGIQDLGIGYECVIHLSMDKVKELETYFQSYDLLLSKGQISEVQANNKCASGLTHLESSIVSGSKDLRKVYIYGLKPKKSYTIIPCN